MGSRFYHQQERRFIAEFYLGFVHLSCWVDVMA